MFRPINAIFGSKNQQKIHPEKTFLKETSKPTHTKTEKNTNVSNYTITLPETIRTNISDTMSTISTIVHLDNESYTANQIDKADPCNTIYARCKDPSAYDILRIQVRV